MSLQESTQFPFDSQLEDASMNKEDISLGENAHSDQIIGGQDLVPRDFDDHQKDDFDPSIKDDVIYEINDEPQFNDTRALFIGNLREPFENEVLRETLGVEASKAHCIVERAWLNSRRTHCIVIVSDVPGAVAIRKSLNGKIFPFSDESEMNSELNRLPLYIDFIPVKATQMWIDQEIYGPRDAVWKVSYTEVPSKKQPGTTFTVSTHKMLNYFNHTWGYRSSARELNRGSSRSRGNRRRDRYPRDGRRRGNDRYYDGSYYKGNRYGRNYRSGPPPLQEPQFDDHPPMSDDFSHDTQMHYHVNGSDNYRDRSPARS